MGARAANDNVPQQSQSSAGSATHSRDSLSVGELFDKYLDWCQRHREKRTYDGYVWHLQKFLDHLRDRAIMPALSLLPFHMVEWLDAHPDWGQTYRRNATGAVQRAYNWAEELGHIESNPVRRIKKPMARRREEFVAPEDWAKIRDAYKPGDAFRVFLEFCWATGCRPQEARVIEGRHVYLDKALIAIPPKEAKGRKRWRITRRGPGVLRKLLVECAWRMLRYNPRARAQYARLTGGGASRKKPAVVAPARKLLVRCWAMLRTKQRWRADPAPEGAAT